MLTDAQNFPFQMWCAVDSSILPCSDVMRAISHSIGCKTILSFSGCEKTENNGKSERRHVGRSLSEDRQNADSPSDCAILLGRRVPLSLHQILERLQRGLYQDTGEWIADMNLLFSIPQKKAKNSLRAAATDQLFGEYETLLAALSPSLSPHTIRLQLAEWRLDTFIRRASITPAAAPRGSPPGAEIFKEPPICDDPLVIANHIRNLFAPNLLLRVAAFLYTTQPDALVFGEGELHIQFTLITPDNRVKLRDYIADLMQSSATGAIPPVVGSTMDESAPALLTEVL
jgi:hypothetical protein